jgi:hypothetical protein
MNQVDKTVDEKAILASILEFEARCRDQGHRAVASLMEADFPGEPPGFRLRLEPDPRGNETGLHREWLLPKHPRDGTLLGRVFSWAYVEQRRPGRIGPWNNVPSHGVFSQRQPLGAALCSSGLLPVREALETFPLEVLLHGGEPVHIPGMQSYVEALGWGRPPWGGAEAEAILVGRIESARKDPPDPERVLPLYRSFLNGARNLYLPSLVLEALMGWLQDRSEVLEALPEWVRPDEALSAMARVMASRARLQEMSWAKPAKGPVPEGAWLRKVLGAPVPGSLGKALLETDWEARMGVGHPFGKALESVGLPPDPKNARACLMALRALETDPADAGPEPVL